MDYNKLYSEACDHYIKGNWIEANEGFIKCLDSDISNEKIIRNLYNVYMKLEEYDRLHDLLIKYKRHLDDSEYEVKLLSVLRKKGNLSEIMKLLKRKLLNSEGNEKKILQSFETYSKYLFEFKILEADRSLKKMLKEWTDKYPDYVNLRKYSEEVNITLDKFKRRKIILENTILTSEIIQEKQKFLHELVCMCIENEKYDQGLFAMYKHLQSFQQTNALWHLKIRLFFNMGLNFIYLDELKAYYNSLEEHEQYNLFELERENLKQLFDEPESLFNTTNCLEEINYILFKLDWVSVLLKIASLDNISKIDTYRFIDVLNKLIRTNEYKEKLIILIAKNINKNNFELIMNPLNLRLMNHPQEDVSIEMIYRSIIISEDSSVCPLALNKLLRKLFMEFRFKEFIYYHSNFNDLIVDTEGIIGLDREVSEILELKDISDIVKKLSVVGVPKSNRIKILKNQKQKQTPMNEKFNYIINCINKPEEIIQTSFDQKIAEVELFYNLKTMAAKEYYNNIYEALRTLFINADYSSLIIKLQEYAVFFGMDNNAIGHFDAVRNYTKKLPADSQISYVQAQMLNELFDDTKYAISILVDLTNSISAEDQAYYKNKYLLYQLYLKNGEIEKALTEIREISDFTVDNRFCYIELLMKMGKVEDVFEQFKQLFKYNLHGVNYNKTSLILDYLMDSYFNYEVYKFFISFDSVDDYKKKLQWKCALAHFDLNVLYYLSSLTKKSDQLNQKMLEIESIIDYHFKLLIENPQKLICDLQEKHKNLKEIHNLLPLKIHSKKEVYEPKKDVSKFNQIKTCVKHILLAPFDTDLQLELAIKLSFVEENEFVGTQFSYQSVIETTYSMFKIAWEELHKNNATVPDVKYKEYYYFLNQNPILRKIRNIYYERALYYAVLINKGIIDRVEELSQKHIIDEFHYALTKSTNNLYFVDTDTEKVNKGRSEFEKLLTSDYFKKMEFHDKLEQAVKNHLEKKNDVKFEIYDAYSKEEKDEFLIRLTYLKDYDTVQKYIDRIISHKNDPFKAAIKKYIEKINTQPYDVAFLHLLSQKYDSKKMLKLAEYAKSFIQNKNYEMGYEIFGLFKNIQVECGITSFYYSIFKNFIKPSNSLTKDIGEAINLIVNSILNVKMEDSQFDNWQLTTPTMILTDLLKSATMHLLFSGETEDSIKKIFEPLYKVLPKIKEIYDDLPNKNSHKIDLAYETLKKMLDRRNDIYKGYSHCNNLSLQEPVYIEFTLKFIYNDTNSFLLDRDKFEKVLFNQSFGELLNTLYNIKFRNVVLTYLACKESRPVELSYLDSLNDNVFELARNKKNKGQFSELNDFIEYLKEEFSDGQYENQILKYLDLGVYLFEWHTISNKLKAVLTSVTLSFDQKITIVDFCINKSKNSQDFLFSKAHLLFKNKDYIGTYEVFKSINTTGAKMPQAINNIFLISHIVASDDLSILNTKHEEIKSLFRRFHRDLSLSNEKNVVLKKLEDSRYSALLLAWWICYYSVNKNYSMARALQVGLLKLDEEMGKYYEDKIKGWESEDKSEYASPTRWTILDVIENNELKVPAFEAYMKQLFSQNQIKLESEIVKSLKENPNADIIQRNNAFAQSFYSISDEVRQVKELQEYMVFLIDNHDYLIMENIESIYIDGLRILEHFSDESNENIEYYCYSIIHVMARKKDVYEMSESYGKILEIIKPFSKISSEFLELIYDKAFDNLWRIDEKDNEYTINAFSLAYNKLLNVNLSADTLKSSRDNVVDTISKILDEKYKLYFKNNTSLNYFISYSRRDLDKVTEVVKELKADKSKKLWFDQYDLKASKHQFRTHIANAIEKSDAVLFFMSENVLKNYKSIYDYEFLPAQKDNKTICTIWLGGKIFNREDINREYKNVGKDYEMERTELDEMFAYLGRLQSLESNDFSAKTIASEVKKLLKEVNI